MHPGRGASWGYTGLSALSKISTLLASHPGCDDLPFHPVVFGRPAPSTTGYML
jgi:hypothetical protein